MKDRNTAPSANEFGKLRSWMARNGISQAEIKEAIGNTVSGRSRSEITSQLKAWLKTRYNV